MLENIVSLKPKPALESECAVLGALILDSKLFQGIENMLCAADFYFEKHQKIFNAMRNLFSKHQCFDAPMLLDYLDYDNSEDMGRIYNMAQNCISTNNIRAHAEIIREKSVQRQLIECANELREKEESPEGSTEGN